MSVHGTTASVNQEGRTCTVLFYQGGISRLQTLDGGTPKTIQKHFVVVCQRTPRSTDILPYAVATVYLPATVLIFYFSL